MASRLWFGAKPITWNNDDLLSTGTLGNFSKILTKIQ